MNYAIESPLCRASDPIESYQAADAAKQLIKTHERLIVSVLAEHGAMGVDGVAGCCGLSAHAIGKRMVALERNGLVKLTGRVVKSAAGCRQREWAVCQ